MNVQKILFQTLGDCADVTAELAASEINPAAPAIYDNWAQEWSEYPFIVCGFSTEYSQPYKSITRLELDLYTERDQQRANMIMQRVIGCLNNKKLFDETGAYYRFYYEGDGEVLTVDETITNWNAAFTLVCWETKTPRSE
jgi:hypothetical protein